MPDKKPIDNEIKKALECCGALDKGCQKCLYNETFGSICIHFLCKDTLDLINRLQTKNDNLRKEMEGWRNTAYHEASQCETAKAEAYKEFAERLKENSIATFSWKGVVMVEEIDNLLKELERKENTTYDD